MASELGLDLYENGWDRTLIYLGSLAAEPAVQLANLYHRVTSRILPGEFDQYNSRVTEIAVRGLVALGSIATTLVLRKIPVTILKATAAAALVARFILRPIGFKMQKNGMTYITTQAPEERVTDKGISVASQNILGIGGGFQYTNGGCVRWESRVDGIVKNIGTKKSAPTVLVLNEVYDAALAEALVEKYKDTYHHIGAHMGAAQGPLSVGNVGGVMVFSKAKPNYWKHISFKNNDWTLNRGFSILEIGEGENAFRIIGTHLIHGPSTATIRNRLETDLDDIWVKLEARAKAREITLTRPEGDEIVKQLSDISHRLEDAEDKLGIAIKEQVAEMLAVAENKDSIATAKRKVQFEQIVQAIKERPTTMPTIICGDLNMELSEDEEGGWLEKYLVIDRENLEDPTCTNKLTQRWKGTEQAAPDERIDYMTYFKEDNDNDLPVKAPRVTNNSLIKGFETRDDGTIDSATALSDHHGKRANFASAPIPA